MRKRNEDDSSLELLLDTMCNTFGGIVFITILVALITNDTTKIINQIKYSKYPSTNNIKDVKEELKFKIQKLQEENKLSYIKVDDLDIKMLKETERSELKKLVSEHSLLVQKLKYEALIKYGGTTEGQVGLLRALKWLKSVQNENGSWGKEYNYALTSLVMVAYLNYGIDNYDDVFGESFVKAFRWLMEESQKTEGMNGSTSDEHATFTFAMAELNKFIEKRDLRANLKDEVQVIIDGQNLDGGFNFNYDEKSQSQLYVTLLNTLALRSTEFSGYDNPEIANMRTGLAAYFENNINESFMDVDGNELAGGQLNQNSSNVTCMFGLQLLGESEKTIESLTKAFPKSFKTLSWDIVEPQPMFTWYCLSRAYFEAEIPEWNLWSKKFQNMLVEKQNAAGFWEQPPGTKYKSMQDKTDSRIYNTSFACLMLSIFYNNKDENYNNRTDILITERPPKSDIEMDNANFPVLIKYMEETHEDLSNYYKQLEETKTINEVNYTKDTQKKPIWIVIKNKRLYYLSRVAHNVDQEWDTNFVTVDESDEGKTFAFKDFKNGFPLSSKNDMNIALSRIINNLGSIRDKYYLDLFVFDDSFLEFSEVKNVIKDYGLLHYWYPYSKEFSVVLSITESARRRAQ